MSTFMNKDFLLSTETAKKLFHEVASKMPILDYHCHLSPREIAEDVSFENITRLWLCDNGAGDHYKWRMMRACGVDEKYITGDAPDKEKFMMWAKTLEKCIGNPVFSFSHLELQRYFGVNEMLSSKNWEEVWNICNEKLASPEMTARKIIENSGVTLLCTTDDPADTLEYHKIIRDDESFKVQVLPAYRPDKAMICEAPGYPDYLKKLETTAGKEIHSFKDLMNVLEERMEFFHEMGCRASDHALINVNYAEATEEELETIFQKAVAAEKLTDLEITKFKSAFLLRTANVCHRLDWGMQLHYGCIRNNNTPMFEKLGPDTGYDAIAPMPSTQELGKLLNALHCADSLPKTVLYSLNPTENAVIVTTMQCFQGGAAGKMQQGSAWWFNDHKKGMIDQMTTLAADGVLGNFIGMLTDSRSFLSYTRHEYFRRLLCDLIGEYVENGEYPDDKELTERLVRDISYNNAVRYFGFDLETVE